MDRARGRMDELGVDALLCSVGPDLPYLSGYEAPQLERLTMLVVPRGEEATLVVPRLEAPRVEPQPDVFRVLAWDETDDPVAAVAGIVGAARRVAIGDQTWARFVLALQASLGDTQFVTAGLVLAPLRATKDDSEIAALRRAAHAVDVIAVAMRDRPFAGRTERDVQRELINRMLDAGHERANFAIVGCGPNAASPHHDATARRIEAGDVILCDFGGTMGGYCSDITRMYIAGEPTAEVVDAYGALVRAQDAAVSAATVDTPCEDVDGLARRLLGEANLADRFIHRIGHGIGLEAHEDPYLVAGNHTRLAPGHAFSVEPGVYFPGRFGLRLEDIVVATPDGPDRLNQASRELVPVD